MDLNLKNKFALVTAASSGLGLACAEALAKEGVSVAICSHNLERITKVANEIANKTGSNVKGFFCDLTDTNNINLLLTEIKKYFGKIEIFVFNHGNLPPGPFSVVNIEQWYEGISMCLSSAIQICHSLIPDMKKNQWGRIIFISSIFAKEPDSNYVVSSTLRSGLLSLSKCLAREFASYGITVNTVLPGYFNTPLLRCLAEKEGIQSGKDIQHVLNEWANNIPSKKFLNPDKLGMLVAFLSSDLADYISGASIVIDGCNLKGL